MKLHAKVALGDEDFVILKLFQGRKIYFYITLCPLGSKLNRLAGQRAATYTLPCILPYFVTNIWICFDIMNI